MLSFDLFSLDPLLSYYNVRLRYFNTVNILQRSKLWSWFVQSDWQHSHHRDTLLWFALSIHIIYKHGGTVLSWDSLSLDTLPSPENPVIAACEEGVLATNVISFPAKHQVIENMLDLAEKTPTLETFNTFSLQTEILRVCKTEDIEDLKFKQCLDFKPLLPTESFCPVEKSRYWQIFDDKRSAIVMRQVKQSKTLNLWLEQSQDIKSWVSPSSNNAFTSLAQTWCFESLRIHKEF